MKAHEIAPCPDCGSQHLGRCGGLSFAARLRSVRLDTSVTATRTLRNYYDRDSIKEMFGDSARDQYMDETDGRGAVFDVNSAAPEHLEAIIGGPDE